MLFNSVKFIVFLVVMFICYWNIPHKYRRWLLLIGSYYFYMSWNVRLVGLIFGITLVSYIGGRFIQKLEDTPWAKRILVGGISVCLGVLIFFKYFNFVNQTLVDVLDFWKIDFSGITVDVILPVGISFYTFQALSYMVDVYKKRLEAERSFSCYALYISFFFTIYRRI